MKVGFELARIYGLSVIVGLISVVIALLGEDTISLIQYDRNAIANFQWWRLFSGHFAHLGTSHLLLNLAGLALITALFARTMSLTLWSASFLVSAFFISIGLYLLNPHMIWYVGLSGILHGLFVTGAFVNWRNGLRLEGFLLLALAGKLAWEQYAGPLPGSEDAAGGPVAVDAHLYGAVGGLAVALGWLAIKMRNQKQ